jgi:excisionase family DNA binding protein
MEPTLIAVTLDERTVAAIAASVAERLAAQMRAGTGDDRWLTTRGAAEYLGLSVSALHRLTARRDIPFEQSGPGSRCYFRRSDLDAWRAR